MTQNAAYWQKWAKTRGAYYYETRLAWDSAEGSAHCISDEVDLQQEFIEGWQEAERAEKLLAAN